MLTPLPPWGSRCRHGMKVWGQMQRHQGAEETTGLLPVPERGRGPGQSALEDAGLPEARGHPGAAQPVGEEDRAAQKRGGGRAGPPWARITGRRGTPTWQEDTCARWLGEGAGPGAGAPRLCTCHPGWWILRVPGSSMALSATSGRVPCLGSCPHTGLQPPLQPQREVVGGRLLQLWVPIRLLLLCAPAGGLGAGGQESGWTVGPQSPTSAGRL